MYKREINDEWSFKSANTKDFTHCYHTYPAMMIPQVARRLINEYKPEGDFHLIFDPYCGSGTTLVEASLIGVDSVGTDLNPLARLMAKTKNTHFDVIKIKYALTIVQSEIMTYSQDKVVNTNFDRISNYTFWYTTESLYKLSFISQAIELLDDDVKDFFNLCLSETVRDVSFTRNGEFKRYRMNKKQLENFNPDVFRTFEFKCMRNIKGLTSFNDTAPVTNVRVCDFNTSTGIPLDILPLGSVDMIVTSPPYGDSHTTVAYGQFSRWANEWFDFDNAKNLDKILMGGIIQKEFDFETTSIKDTLDQICELDEKRYFEVATFLNDYWHSISNVSKVVRTGGIVCYVVGNRRVKSLQIDLDYFTAEMFEKCGFEHINTIVREIPNKRMPSKTSPTNVPGAKVATMSNEYIVIMKKIM